MSVTGRRKEKTPELEPIPVYGPSKAEPEEPQEQIKSTPTTSKVIHAETGNPWKDRDPDQKPETLILPGEVEHTWTPAEATRSLHEQYVAPPTYGQRDRPAPQKPDKPHAEPTTNKTVIHEDLKTDKSSWAQAHGKKKDA